MTVQLCSVDRRHATGLMECCTDSSMTSLAALTRLALRAGLRIGPSVAAAYELASASGTGLRASPPRSLTPAHVVKSLTSADAA